MWRKPDLRWFSLSPPPTSPKDCSGFHRELCPSPTPAGPLVLTRAPCHPDACQSCQVRCPKRVLGLPEYPSSFGPNSTRPAQIWPYACVPDPNCSEPSREGRASVRNRAVECRFRARYAGWRFWLWGVKTAISRNGDIEPLPNLLF